MCLFLMHAFIHAGIINTCHIHRTTHTVHIKSQSEMWLFIFGTAGFFSQKCNIRDILLFFPSLCCKGRPINYSECGENDYLAKKNMTKVNMLHALLSKTIHYHDLCFFRSSLGIVWFLPRLQQDMTTPTVLQKWRPDVTCALPGYVLLGWDLKSLLSSNQLNFIK